MCEQCFQISRGGQVVRYYVSFPSVFVSRIVEVRYVYVLLYVRCVTLQLAALTWGHFCNLYNQSEDKLKRFVTRRVISNALSLAGNQKETGHEKGRE